MSVKIVLFFTFIVLQINQGFSETVTLQISDGDIVGQVGTTVRQNITYYSFRGIPYAEPPVGDLRFASPVKNSPWNGTLNATYDRSECPQYSSDDLLGTTLYGAEDCLYINVYTPDVNENFPSVVWIYGGAFMTGNSSFASFGPDYFLEQGIVFVSFNYRLGILGFLSTEDEACPGNWGIKDQVLALQWVQENIAYFGGDPGNVTIFGESAGAVSVSLLMQTNMTEGLFHRAIMNSGTTLNLWGLNTRAAATATLVSTNMGIITTNKTTMINELRKVDVEKVMNVGSNTAWTLFLTNGLRGLPYAPTIEPNIEGALYTNPSDAALSAGLFHKVPVLMGFNSEEAVSAGSVPHYIDIYLNYYGLIVGFLTPYSLTSDEIKRFICGQDIKLNFFGDGTLGNRENLIKFVSADQFNRPIRRAAGDMANYTDVYFYEFGYQGNVSVQGEEREFDGTGHAEDVYYLFNIQNSTNYTNTDLYVSETMVLLWSNFIKYGKPTPFEDERLNNTIWEPVKSDSDDFTYLSINQSVTLAANPKESDWQYYQNAWRKYYDGTAEDTTY
ncbi:hypothetical protein ABEB36_006005 [Hypothenemus hampei]|uniref:Carboxylic ester hydrolase n=1 Tax=Hypothenemus hampei TaxID=57062 RepID=A0ABD1F055_HYPHA